MEYTLKKDFTKQDYNLDQEKLQKKKFDIQKN